MRSPEDTRKRQNSPTPRPIIANNPTINVSCGVAVRLLPAVGADDLEPEAEEEGEGEGEGFVTGEETGDPSGPLDVRCDEAEPDGEGGGGAGRNGGEPERPGSP